MLFFVKGVAPQTPQPASKFNDECKMMNDEKISDKNYK